VTPRGGRTGPGAAAEPEPLRGRTRWRARSIRGSGAGAAAAAASGLPVQRGQAEVDEAPVAEGGQGGCAGGGGGQAGEAVGPARAGVLLAAEVDAVRRVHRGVLIEVVVGPQEKADAVPHGHRVGDIFSVGDVQEPHGDPGNQVLHGGSPAPVGLSGTFPGPRLPVWPWDG